MKLGNVLHTIQPLYHAERQLSEISNIALSRFNHIKLKTVFIYPIK